MQARQNQTIQSNAGVPPANAKSALSPGESSVPLEATGGAHVTSQYRGHADSSDHAVYNSRIPCMSMPLRSLRAACRIPMILLLLGVRLWSSNWDAPTLQLAGKISAATGPGAVAFELNNRSSLGRNEIETIRRALIEQLMVSGLRFVAVDQAAATVQVSLSENLSEYLWVAEIRLGADERSVVMVSVPREGALPSGEAPPLSIRKMLLWSSPEKILDVAVINGAFAHMLVLHPTGIKFYKLQKDAWQEEQSLAVPHNGVWPRDLRGRLVLRKDHLFDAYLPGMVCQSNSGPPLAVTCRESDDPWPVGTDQFNLNAFYASARNFFPGAISPGIGKKSTAPAFYTAAPLPRDKYTLWLLAAVDGRVHMLDGVTDLTAAKLDWGSDIATVHSSCGTGWQVIATASGARPGDMLQAYELPDREAVAIGPPSDLPGGVTALWSQSEGTTAAAIVRNPETGRYEAYLLSVNCSQ